MSGGAESTVEDRNSQAHRMAVDAIAGGRVTSTGLVSYRSRGRVAIIGGSEAMEFAPRLHGVLQPMVILVEGEEMPGVPVIPLGGRNLHIEGYLGAFKISMGEVDRATGDLVEVDLILDFSRQPLLSVVTTPVGYFHTSTDEADLAPLIDELSALTGTFEKPCYLNYDTALCAHARAGHVACTRCIDACPTGAITPLTEFVRLDDYLCQGDGVCTTVCPNGALRYAYPGVSDLLDRLRMLLRVYREQGGGEPVLALFPESQDKATLPVQGHLLPLMLEDLASVGLEVWLSALAFGAGRVLLVDDGSLPVVVMRALQGQLDSVSEILLALGYPEDAVSLIPHATLAQHLKPLMPMIKPAGFSGVGGKRTLAFMAINHLHGEASRPKPMANLSVGIPFGTADVDGKRCTLCFSCVSSCPGKALQTGYGELSLQFIEANCLQCGTCTRICPEDAIWITPRLLFDQTQRSKLRRLHEEAPFNCTACGKPFATRSIIDSIQQKLLGHWMFQDERARSRLTMCDNCRVVDIVQDPDVTESHMGG